MAASKIELRVAALEAEVAQLKQMLASVIKPAKPWWEEIVGAFENDPIYEEAMRLGREYRESLRSKPRSKSSNRVSPAQKRKLQ